MNTPLLPLPRLAGAALLAAALGFGAATANAETVYHWIDERGVKVFSDRPPPSTVEHEVRRVGSRPADQVPAFSVRRAAANFPVALYTTDDCGTPCDQARALLQQRGIPFTEHVVDTEEDLEAFREVFGPPDEVPAATVGPRQLRNFQESAWHALLDNVGYPREAPPPD